MRVLKAVLEGLTTSFRYPHFMQQIQPSFSMPPPATIYGHVCSALGTWFDPDGVQFAYHFTTQGRMTDLEHIHVLSAAGGKVPGTTLPKVLEGNINPFEREVLFQPRMVLYLNRPEWEQAFREPRYPVVLGRSHDLCSYTSISVVELEQHDRVYLEHTLLPYGMATRTSVGTVALMPRWIDYRRNRQPTFDRYLVLERRIRTDDDTFLAFGTQQHEQYWVDPTAPQIDGVPLGLVFHMFGGARDTTTSPFAVA
jgi:CRISPR-associated protein Cas5t